MKIASSVAVVTGAGGGLGRAIALELGRRGADVAVVDVDEPGATQTATLVRGLGRRAEVMVASVARRQEMLALPAAVERALGAANILVNNAGVNLGKTFVDQTLEDADWLLGVNLYGALHGCHAFLPGMRARGAGHVVNISSMAAFIGLPTQSLYSASKAAVGAFSESLRAELSGSGIGVTAVYPGALRTGLLRTARFNDDDFRARLVELSDRHLPLPAGVARRVVRAIERNHGRVVARPDAHLLDLSARWAPRVTGALFELVTRLRGV